MSFIFTPMELLDAIIMTLAVGFMFKGVFQFSKINTRKKEYDPLEEYKKPFKTKGFEDFKFAVLVTAPAILLHELAHKFLALAYGLEATFHAAYAWLGIGVLLKLLGTGIIFFVPAFVSVNGLATPLVHSMIAFAGPLINLLVFVVAFLIEKYGNVTNKYLPLLVLTKRINLFLFIFNMLPIPLFDGFTVYKGLVAAFF